MTRCARSLTPACAAQVILNGKVYDVTAFMPDHPGGKKAIMLYAGKDASEEFNMLHGARMPVLRCVPAAR